MKLDHRRLLSAAAALCLALAGALPLAAQDAAAQDTVQDAAGAASDPFA